MPAAAFGSCDWPLPDWPRWLGRPQTTGRIRTEIEDFRVWEIPLIEPEGSGPHLWLEVEKRDANTQWLARRLAASAGARVGDVGFAGMKDRQAVTTQWFSIDLQRAAQTDWSSWDIPGVTILRAVRHRRKLQRGALKGNRFRIVVRDLSGERAELEQRLQRVGCRGVPNYFGPQRFGHDGANVRRAAHWLETGGGVSRSLRGIYLSAMRSYFFNRVLSERVEQRCWDRLLNGDVARLDGSRSTFACGEPDADLQDRCRKFDIHPTGPLPGRVSARPGNAVTGEAAGIEQSVLQPHHELIEALARAGVKADRRSLRIVPSGLEWQVDETSLTLEFSLPSGAYATSVLRELVLAGSDTISGNR